MHVAKIKAKRKRHCETYVTRLDPAAEVVLARCGERANHSVFNGDRTWPVCNNCLDRLRALEDAQCDTTTRPSPSNDGATSPPS